MFKKVLIANRGEIACRIARTCQRMGIAVAGVHSSADAGAFHVKAIGESIEIGGPAAFDSYLLEVADAVNTTLDLNTLLQRVAEMLKRVKEKGTEKRGLLSPEEFREIVDSVLVAKR